MKSPLSSLLGLVVVASFRAAEPTDLGFGQETIGIPPLSLAETVRRSTAIKTPPANPGIASLDHAMPATPLSGTLLPQRASATRVPSPRTRVDRSSGMPVIEPRGDVDYKLGVAPPDPTIAFKLIIKDPLPALDPAATK